MGSSGTSRGYRRGRSVRILSRSGWGDRSSICCWGRGRCWGNRGGHDVVATHGTRAVLLEPGFDALSVYNVAARQALARAPNHFRHAHDAGVVVRQRQLLACDGGKSSVDGGVDGAKSQEVADPLLERPQSLVSDQKYYKKTLGKARDVHVANDVQGDADDAVDDGEEGEVRKYLEQVAAEVDVKNAHAQAGPSTTHNVQHVPARAASCNTQNQH